MEPPVLLVNPLAPDLATNRNVSLTGRVTDNVLAGVTVRVRVGAGLLLAVGTDGRATSRS